MLSLVCKNVIIVFLIEKKVFLLSQKDRKLGFLSVALAILQFLTIHGRDWKLGFLNISLDCTSQFFPFH